MTLSARRKLVLPSVIVSAVIFSVMTVPLAIVGDKQVGIKIQEESFFHGRLRDVAAPYVVFATLLSFGAGISIAALVGWEHYTRKSSDYKKELSEIKGDLQVKEELLQELKLSESRLQVSGLNDFLDYQNSHEVENFTSAASQPVFTENSVSVSESNVNLSVDESYQIASFSDKQKETSDSQESEIHSEIDNHTIYSDTKDGLVNETNVVRSEIEELQLQMKNMMSRINQLQMETKSVSEQDISHTAPENLQAYYNAVD